MNQKVIEIPPSVSRQYLIEGKNGFLLIDTGLKNNYAHITRFLGRSGISLAEIELILITHADGDHFGCLSHLQSAQPGIVSAASEIEAAAIRQGKSSRKLTPSGVRTLFYALAGPFVQSPLTRIDRILTIGEELPYLGGLEVLDTRGHTPGHISIWSKTTRTLFCGDSITIKGKALSPSTGGNTWDLEKSRISFENQLALQPDRIYAGHGTWQRE